MEITGNLVSEPELRYSQSGVAVASFTIASTERVFDKQTGEYKDGETLFLRCSVWRDLAEHVATLAKGTRVIVSGKLRQRNYETKEGEKRTSIEVAADDVAVSLKFATVQVQRTSGSTAWTGTSNTQSWDEATASAGWAETKYPDETPF